MIPSSASESYLVDNFSIKFDSKEEKKDFYKNLLFKNIDNLRLVKISIEKGNIDVVNIFNTRFQNPLNCAFESGNKDVIKYILSFYDGDFYKIKKNLNKKYLNIFLRWFCEENDDSSFSDDSSSSFKSLNTSLDSV